MVVKEMKVENKKGQKEVKIYSTPTCVYCNAAKDFFRANGVVYSEFDVAADFAKRKEMIEKSGQMGVPVIMIGEDLIVGFDEVRIADALGVV
jgi:glutaredoxin-like YruB-family protein